MALLLKYFLGAFIRAWLIRSDFWQVLSNRVEIATPLNSWRRLVEGVHLYDRNIDPYDGDIFHESPILLVVFHFLMKRAPFVLPALYVAVDMLTAHLLHKTSETFMNMLKEEQKNKAKEYHKEAATLLITDEEFKKASKYVLIVYLFNPYTILNCAGMTTTVFSNLFLACAFYGMVHGCRVLACIAIALATHQSLYPILLIVPASLSIANVNKGCAKCSYLKTLLVFVLAWAFMVFASAFIMDGSYKYFYNTYGFILTVPDLKPNIGLFWYFFTEVFEHFRLLFICAFQINGLVLYIVPLTLKFHKEPMLLATTLVALGAIFRPYPCIGDVGFYLALMPMWRHLFSCMQQKFIVASTFIIASAIGPTVWHLWIYSRSANANFYFGATLAFATAQIFLITDLLFAYIKREYDLKYGLTRVVDGQPAKLILR